MALSVTTRAKMGPVVWAQKRGAGIVVGPPAASALRMKGLSA